MGLFDDVKVESPLLPEEHRHLNGWQTKDTDDIDGGCYMRQFRISVDGLLELKCYRDEGTYWDTILKMELTASVFDHWEPVDFHGDIRFYTTDPPVKSNDEPCEWVEYRARFDDGKLRSLTRVEQGK